MNTQAIAPIPCTPNGLAYFGGFDRRAQTAAPARTDPLTPTPQDLAALTDQYRKAVNGLYEAYLFGQMLLAVKARLEAAARDAGQGAPHPLHPAEAQGASPRFSSSATRGTAREVTIGKNGNALTGSGWNAGTGLKAWLAQHCPEINYSTARRFLAVAEKTHAALAAGDPAAPGAWGEAPCASAGAEGAAQAPSEADVRAFLEGKSQRQILRTGGAREGAGRPRKNWTEALGTSPEAAMKRLEEALAPLNELIVVRQTHRLLSALDLETVRDAVDLLHERVHAEI